jgi:hypothetical protein
MAEDEDSMDNEEPQPQRANMREIAEVVKSFYDRETGRFPKGETGVIVHCKKMFGDQGGQLAERLVTHLSQRSQQQMAYEDLTRIMKLAGMKVTESKPSAGLSKGQKSSIAKKAKAGKDIGKPGKSFDKVAKAAGGGEKGKRIAAAAMWKNAAR